MAYKTSKTFVALLDNGSKYRLDNDGREWWVSALPRHELMKLAATVANNRGDKGKAGLGRTNDQMITYLQEVGTWKADSPTPAPAPEPKPYDADGKIPTSVTCSCGHTVTYRVRPDGYDRKVKWLASKPCYRCETGKGTPTPSPTPKPAPKAPKSRTLLDKVLALVAAKRAVWLGGGPGVGKSHLAGLVAERLGVSLYPVSCHAQMNEAKLLGYVSPITGETKRTPFREAFEHGGVFLLDEVDNGNSNLLAALNSALSNGFMQFEDALVYKHENFVCIATANTKGHGPEAGYLGRQAIDLATLDRFCALEVPIDEALEERLVREINPTHADSIIKAVRAIRKHVETNGLGVLVTPRTSLDAAHVMNHGFTLEEALRMKDLRRLDSVQWRAVKELIQ